MKIPIDNSVDAVLPPLYAAWMDELLQAPIPHETNATCDDCAMCSADSTDLKTRGYYFDASIKCCTFVPQLPNFLVGRALSDEDRATAAGRATLLKRLESGVAVTPHGIGRHPTFNVLYDHVTKGRGFGRNHTIRCPHYLDERGGLCGIWRHREATCATYFCKHVRGGVGRRFWNAVHQLLSVIENDLKDWCLIELDLDAGAVRRLLQAQVDKEDKDPIEEGEIDGIPAPRIRRAIWGKWFSRQSEFYQECGRLVGHLHWEDVLAICGPDVALLARIVQDAFVQLLATNLPSRLRVTSFEQVRTGHESCRIVGYSALDPIDIPKPVMNSLPYFEGRSTDDALAAIASQTGVRIDVGLVRKLVDFGILESAESAPANPNDPAA